MTKTVCRRVKRPTVLRCFVARIPRFGHLAASGFCVNGQVTVGEIRLHTEGRPANMSGWQGRPGAFADNWELMLQAVVCECDAGT